jgi:hypothetical protein
MHNYFVYGATRLTGAGISLYKYTPLTTMEDTTSEVTVGLYPQSQPPSDGFIINTCATSRPFEIALGDSVNGGRSDSRIYFPHMRTDDALSDLLASFHRPYPTGIVSTKDTDLFSRKIDEHQGIDDPTLVQRYDYLTGQNTRNTEVGGRSVFYPSRYKAPDPITANTPNAVCEQPNSLTNYGDRVMGKDFNSTLVYYQHFEYTPQYRYDISSCKLENQTCTTDEECCAFLAGYDGGGCEGYREAYCAGPSPCPTYSDSTSCNGDPLCTWRPERPGRCGEWPRRELNSRARVSVFTKSPLVEKVYDTLVVGDQSVLRRFLPLKPTNWPYPEYINGEMDIENTIPGESVVNYTGSTNDLDSDQITGGDGNLPVDIYYDRIGSLADHFLGDITPQRANLQKALRPKDLIPTVPITPGATLPPGGTVLQHLFENTCGQLCSDYLLSRVRSETSCNGKVLNPYFAVAIALNENGGLVSCEPGGTRFNHYGCDLQGLAGYSTTIDSKTSCMINTLVGNCRAGLSDLENLQRYGYAQGAASLDPLDVLNNPNDNLFISASDANTYANILRSTLAGQRLLWWKYYCGYINNYAQSECNQFPDACNAPPP